MAKRRLSHYSLFMASYLRTHLHAGATREQAQEAMKEGAKAWQRARAGKNPFPDFRIDFRGEDERESHGETACPECGTHLEVPAGLSGETVVCPQCGAELAVEVV